MLPHVTPFTSCWRNSLTLARWSYAPTGRWRTHARGPSEVSGDYEGLAAVAAGGLIEVLNTFLPPLISSTTSGLDALRLASSVIVPVTPA